MLSTKPHSCSVYGGRSAFTFDPASLLAWLEKNELSLGGRKFTQWRVQRQSHVIRSSRSNKKAIITVSQERLKLFFSEPADHTLRHGSVYKVGNTQLPRCD